MGEEIKDQKITIRVSPTEKKDIETKAEQAKMSMSRYLVAATENKKIGNCNRKMQLLTPRMYDNSSQQNKAKLFYEEYILSSCCSKSCSGV